MRCTQLGGLHTFRLLLNPGQRSPKANCTLRLSDCFCSGNPSTADFKPVHSLPSCGVSRKREDRFSSWAKALICKIVHHGQDPRGGLTLSYLNDKWDVGNIRSVRQPNKPHLHAFSIFMWKCAIKILSPHHHVNTMCALMALNHRRQAPMRRSS